MPIYNKIVKNIKLTNLNHVTSLNLNNVNG